MKYESFRLEKSHQMEKESIIAAVLLSYSLLPVLVYEQYSSSDDNKIAIELSLKKQTDQTFQKKKRLICYQRKQYNVVQVE